MHTVLLRFILLWLVNDFTVKSIDALTHMIWFCVASHVLGHRKIARLPSDVIRKVMPLQWRHNGRGGVPNHQPHDCLLNRLFRHRPKKTPKLRVTGLCAGNSPHKWPVTRKMFPFYDVIMSTIDLNQTTTKRNKAIIVCIFPGAPLQTLITFNPNRDK